jgi:hypothetical protein
MVTLTNDGFLLEGTAYFNRLNDAGQYAGLVELPGIAKLSIKTSADIKDQISKDKGQYGQVTASVAIPKPAELSVGLRNGSKDGVALALMGSHSVLTAGAGTVTDEPLTAKLGAWIELAQRNLTAASVVVTNTGATVTYVENTDYEVNYALGMVKALSGGAIADAAPLKVDYAHAAISGWKVRGATTPQAKGRLILDGRNLINNKSVRFEAYSVLMVADGEFDLMGDDVTEFALSGRLETPTGKTEPFIIEQW